MQNSNQRIVFSNINETIVYKYDNFYMYWIVLNVFIKSSANLSNLSFSICFPLPILIGDKGTANFNRNGLCYTTPRERWTRLCEILRFINGEEFFFEAKDWEEKWNREALTIYDSLRVLNLDTVSSLHHSFRFYTYSLVVAKYSDLFGSVAPG